jgi:hypothetical protein
VRLGARFKELTMDNIIYYWPNDVWCYAEDLEAYLQFMSDDYCSFTINFENNIDIDEHVRWLNTVGNIMGLVG